MFGPAINPKRVFSAPIALRRSDGQNACLNNVYRDAIVGHSPKSMDIHYIVTTYETLTNAMDQYTNWQDSKIFSANIDQTVDQKASKSYESVK